MCYTCALSLKRNKLPTLAIANMKAFPMKPEDLFLNELEERLVSPINAFMQIRELPRGGQKGITGNVVNVPADNLTCVISLPRRLDQSGTIPVKLKRRLRYKSHVLYKNIRPQLCFRATKLLLSKPLYKAYVLNGIDNDWVHDHIHEMRQTEWESLIEPDNSQRIAETDTPEVSNSHHDDGDDEDKWSETDETDECQFGPVGSLDTMMQKDIEDTHTNSCFCVAPSEGNQPITALTPDLEELAYPSIFCGEKRLSNKDRQVPVKYSDIVKSELRRDDRRAAMSISNIFFKAKKLQNKQIQDKVWLALKRVKTKGNTITARDMRDPAKVDKLVRLDEGYKIFRTLRGSPPYWEAAKHDIFAMVRQLGLPTWFFSLSAAETRWPELLQALGRIIDSRVYTETDVNNMTWQTKCRLIRSDPVTTARSFDHRFQAFFRLFLKSPAEPIGKIQDFFYRVEFQQRGSPHIHGIAWVQDAPVYHKSGDVTQVEQFVDKYLTTENSDDVEELIKLQTHRHSHTCLKNKDKACRFHFPLPPMSHTQLLKPLTIDDVLPHEFKIHKENWSRVQSFLQLHSQGMDMTFEQFLHAINMTEDTYILALRSSIKDDRVFLKRSTNAIRVNGFNKHMLKAWKANMDLQFITDPYACAMYVISYISKGQRGMSELMQKACEEARKGDTNIKEQVRTVGNKFLRHVEICAQEAAFLDLQLPMRRSSRGFSFINTSPEDERPFIVKDIHLLENLPDDSDDVKCTNKIKRYTIRPKTLESMTLADFDSNYDPIIYKPKVQKLKPTEEMPESEYEDNLDDDPISDETENKIRLTDGSYMRKRKQKKVIRFRRYSLKKEPENFYREALMLFYPWRKEDAIIDSCHSYEERYMQVKAELEENRAEYEHKADELDNAEEEMSRQNDDDDQWNDLAPCTLHLDPTHNTETKITSIEDHHKDYDIGQDLGLPGSDQMEEKIRNRLTDADFRALVQSLNCKQLEVFYHILHTAKTSDKQQFLFLSGGAGVGKTRVLKCIFQALLRHYNVAEGEDPESIRVLLTAPTGKAAYLIKGNTLHAAFNIPANQGFRFKNMCHQTLNTYRCKYKYLKAICIDEISMCGSNMFQFINLRLQEIMGLTTPFGGVNVICIGDFFQLQPVLDSWVFKGSSIDYSVLAPNLWQDNFRLFELTDVMRQREDYAFAQLLNRMREGLQTKEDISLLKSRIISPSSPSYPPAVTHIMYYNKDVEEHNSRVYEAAVAEKVSVSAVDIVIGDVPEAVAQRVKESAPVEPSKAMGLAKFVKTAVGLRNEMTVNVDTVDGLVNGAGSITKHIQYIPRTSTPLIIWVQFDHPDIGSKLRTESRNLYVNTMDKSWTPVKTITREFPVGRYKNAKLLRRQFPMRLAAAKTVHRCQGDTMEKAVIQLPNRATRHMHYVALSRVTSLDNLYVLGDIYADKITVSSDVKCEMDRLRTKSTLQLSLLPIYNLNQNYFKICFHNSQSLHLHSRDMLADCNFRASTMNLFVESRLCTDDSNIHIQLTGFQIHRNDFSSHRTSYGSIIYYKNNVQCTCHSLNSNNIEITLADVSSPVDMYVICIYSRPKEPLKNLLNALSELQTHLSDNRDIVIMGDFNIHADDTSTAYRNLQRQMASLQCTQLLSVPTTNGGTTIDHIYTTLNVNRIQIGTLESYYSYHKPIWLALESAYLPSV